MIVQNLRSNVHLIVMLSMIGNIEILIEVIQERIRHLNIQIFININIIGMKASMNNRRLQCMKEIDGM